MSKSVRRAKEKEIGPNLREIATRILRLHDIVLSPRRNALQWAEYCLREDLIYKRDQIEQLIIPTLEEIHKHISRYIRDGKERFWDYSKSNPLFWVRKPY